jgi:thiol-disulfide isomerase/thioredoxin
MIKIMVAFFFGLIPLTMHAQSVFTLTGYGKMFAEGDSIFLSYKQGDEHVLDSAVVKNNVFRFKGTCKTISRGYVCRNNNPRTAEILNDAFDIYIEPGNIALRSDDTLKNSLLSGTPLNNDQAKLFTALQPVRDKSRNLKAIENFTAEELRDTVLVRQTKERSVSLFYERISLQLDFINRHLDSYVSVVNLSGIARMSKYLPDVEKSFQGLAPGLKELPEGKDIARRIMEGRKITVGMMSKDFTQPGINGHLITLSDLRGKYVLVDFWASWCSPCREENPNLIAAYKKYRNKNFTIVSVSIDVQENREQWLAAVKKDKLPWQQVSDLKKENEAARLYGITTIPANVLIDPAGKIIAKDLKGKDLHNKLAALLEN